MERERITISIKNNVLKFIDKTIDGINIRNRSHAIEHLVMKGLSRSSEKNAVILLGGKDAMKHLPATEAILDKLKKLEYEKVYVAVGFLSDKIQAKLGDGSKFGIDLEYLTNGEGSGGALLSLKKIFHGTFLVFDTENDIKFNLDNLVEYHKRHGSIATLALNDSTNGEGTYVFEPGIFNLIPKGFSMLNDDIFPKLAEKGEITGYLQF